MQQKMYENRIWELDFLRGIALILMIYFHVVFDMSDIYGFKVNYSSGVNYFIGKTSAILFILVSGISCYFSRSNIKRGLKLFILAMMITLATRLYNPQLAVNFGILHFLALCAIMSPMLKKLNKYIMLAGGTIAIMLNYIVAKIFVTYDYLFVFGIYSDKFFSSDYYPLIPWLGVFLSGLALGKELYSPKKSIFKYTLRNNPISGAGKHTLLYYLIHQPIIIGILYIIKYIS